MDHSDDQTGKAILAMLQKAADQSNDDCNRARTMANERSRRLRATEDRINQLETEIVHFRERTARAEKWLQLIQREIEEILIAPTAAARPTQ
jgi:chromosome segregation ATPase